LLADRAGTPDAPGGTTNVQPLTSAAAWGGTVALTMGDSVGHASSATAAEEAGMAQKIDAFPDARDQSVYPWDEWFDGSVWELIPGEDFAGQPSTFRASAVAQAARRDGKVRTRKLTTEHGERLYLQFYRD
jgi:hypothetical protein